MNVESENPQKFKLIMPDAQTQDDGAKERKGNRKQEYFAGLEKVRERDHDIKRRNGMRTY